MDTVPDDKCYIYENKAIEDENYESKKKRVIEDVEAAYIPCSLHCDINTCAPSRLRAMEVVLQRNEESVDIMYLKILDTYINQTINEISLEIRLSEAFIVFLDDGLEQVLTTSISEEPKSQPASKESIEKCIHSIMPDDSEEVCAICREQFNKSNETIMLHCKHMYHKNCILEWLKEQNTCPICRESLDVKTTD